MGRATSDVGAGIVCPTVAAPPPKVAGMRCPDSACLRSREEWRSDKGWRGYPRPKRVQGDECRVWRSSMQAASEAADKQLVARSSCPADGVRWWPMRPQLDVRVQPSAGGGVK
ncbi:hypothetical protein GGTG_02869 [Gaeumannomyces tritici R3-111a-1]|uniref:Uncharacterized protein n=1 Tax=Gaeumannomyces tritici (strain R3-111a-1) TaxID=644352 RepID=J3NNL2_GAET3|nr:hypothetical protein GGTG_02869 [Gaeumannomyces tritici R3-111a-1]EJT77764.1 hypothetical protein GGTG_02869 [Gaeumannomyces tritici R3-111a-1]